MQIRDYDGTGMVRINDNEFTINGERVTKYGLEFAIGEHEKARDDHAAEIVGIKVVLADMQTMNAQSAALEQTPS